MGGYGSGRTNYKQKAENCRSLDEVDPLIIIPGARWHVGAAYGLRDRGVFYLIFSWT